MSNTNATEGNIESPSAYGQEAYRAYRKKEKKKTGPLLYKKNCE